MQLGDVAHRDLASQIIGVSHAAGIIDTLQPEPECDSTLLGKTFGEPNLAGMDEAVCGRFALAGSNLHDSNQARTGLIEIRRN
jgi:hypothetical protein